MSRSGFPFHGLNLATLTWWLCVPAGWTLLGYGVSQVVTTDHVALAPAFAMTAALAILLELLPLMQGRQHNPQGVVMSTGFVCAIMLTWGAWPAIVMYSVGSLASDLRARKHWWKVLFNPAQYAITVFSAALIVSAARGSATLMHPDTSFHTVYLAWMVVAWAVWILVNFSLVAGVMAIDYTVKETFAEDFWHESTLTFGVLAISPLVLVVGAHYWVLLPLLLIPMLLLYQTGQIAMESEHAAGHDALTGLPNRSTLGFELTRAFGDHGHGGAPFALMLIDLNDFKRVNDSLGHQVGDTLLVRLAERLRDVVRPGDCVARLGGDEFAMLVFDVDAAEAVAVAERIQQAVSETVTIDSISLEISLSLGIALCPEHGVDGTTLLRRADVAMYSAKEQGSGIQLYSAERDDNSSDQLELVGELRQALRDGDIELHYQPKVAAADSSPIGFEALVRWHHPVRGTIPPDRFIALAERSGVMPALTAHVIELAIRQMAAWREIGVDLPVAVNVAPTDLSGTALVTLIDSLLARYGFDPSMLMLEITERMATQHLDEAQRNLHELRARGVRISLDDFGTGYSSLVRLSSLPVDEIKIDRAFVAAMERGDEAVSIVRTLVDLAHARGLPAIAEGVEDHEEWRVLGTLGCDGIQGWHVAKPMPAGEATAWIRSRLAYGPLSPLSGAHEGDADAEAAPATAPGAAESAG